MSSAPLPNLGQFASALIVKPSSLGDIVHTLPAVHALKQAHPHLHIRWLSNPEWAPLLELNTDVQEILPFPRRSFRGLKGIPKFIRWAFKLNTAARETPEITLDFQGLLRSAAVSQARGSGYIVGLSDAREGASLFYRHTVAIDAKAHAVDRYLALPEAFGIPIDKERLHFALPLGTAPRGKTLPPEFLVLHPYSRGEGKSLSHETLQALCDCLAPRPIILVGRNDDAQPINGDHVTSLIGQTDLFELIWLIRHAKGVVSVDSGPMHIAAAITDRTLGIHTWSDPRQVGPYQSGAWVWKAGRIAHRQDFSDAEARSTTTVDLPAVRRMSDFIHEQWY